jgi:Glycosyltransferase
MPFFAPAYGVVARGLRRHYGIPSFAVVHNALPHERHLGDAALSRFFLDACAGHVVMSDAVAADARRLAGPGAQIEQIAHPVYERFGDPVPRGEARAALGLPDDAPVVLFFGFVREYKGLHVLLKAMPDVLADHPDLRLVVAGEPYDDPERYRAIIDRHGLHDRVQWHDAYVPSDAVPTYFCAADLVVQPYVSATQSGVAQIATHFERPMVVTDVGGLAESIPHEEAGFVVRPRTRRPWPGPSVASSGRTGPGGSRRGARAEARPAARPPDGGHRTARGEARGLRGELPGAPRIYCRYRSNQPSTWSAFVMSWLGRYEMPWEAPGIST